jgi:hypothetical protein
VGDHRLSPQSRQIVAMRDLMVRFVMHNDMPASSLTRNHGGMNMTKLLVTLIAGAFTSIAVAQSPTGPTGENSGNTQATAAEQAKNVKASKETAKSSKEERARLAKDAAKSNVNPENSSGSAATATMQKQTTAESKATAKQNTELKSKEGKQQLDKDLQKKSTP